MNELGRSIERGGHVRAVVVDGNVSLLLACLAWPAKLAAGAGAGAGAWARLSGQRLWKSSPTALNILSIASYVGSILLY